MPYITKKKRALFNGYIQNIMDNIKHYSTSSSDSNSMMAYIIYKLIIDLFDKLNWDVKSDALKILEDVKLEYYRRVLAPHADLKIKINGDIY